MFPAGVTTEATGKLTNEFNECTTVTQPEKNTAQERRDNK